MALECVAIQDVLVVGKALDGEESKKQKMELDRIAVMLSRLGGRSYSVKEDSAPYGNAEFDFDSDFDSDFDPDEKGSSRTPAQSPREGVECGCLLPVLLLPVLAREVAVLPH